MVQLNFVGGNDACTFLFLRETSYVPQWLYNAFKKWVVGSFLHASLLECCGIIMHILFGSSLLNLRLETSFMPAMLLSVRFTSFIPMGSILRASMECTMLLSVWFISFMPVGSFLHASMECTILLSVWLTSFIPAWSFLYFSMECTML